MYNKAFAEGKKSIIIEIFLENCNEYICKKKKAFHIEKGENDFHS